jgi:hypothetical protein
MYAARDDGNLPPHKDHCARKRVRIAVPPVDRDHEIAARQPSPAEHGR